MDHEEYENGSNKQFNGDQREDFPKRRSFNEWFEWRYLRWLGYAFVVFILFVLLMDKVVMPLYTKHGREVKMPDITQLPVEEAEQILQEKGFNPIIDTTLYNMTVPENHVISQNPIPGAVVKKGRRTYLTISKGEKWILVPQLVGGSERDAELKLHQADLVIGEKQYDFSSLIPKDVVIFQSIPSGDSVSVGDSVDIIISLGDIPANLKVPNLVGKSYQEARKTLLESGFQLGTVDHQVNNDLLPNTVIQQFPEPDEIVDVGTEINLVLSQIEDKPEEQQIEKE